MKIYEEIFREIQKAIIRKISERKFKKIEIF